MKHFTEEVKEVEVVKAKIRKLEYVRCDECGKIILPGKHKDIKSSYVRIHTWHNDWGNDSIDSHEYNDLCKECAKAFIAEYIDEMEGTEELELEHLFCREGTTERVNL